jgi:hypothetical protein
MPNIHFYVLCSDKINFEDYIRKCMANKKCTISNVDDTFRICYQDKVIEVSFEQTVVSGKRLSELTFAYNILKKIRLSSLAHGIVSVKKCVTYLTNVVVTSGHNCLPDLYSHSLHAPNTFAKCKVYRTYCKEHP